ncbi:hypothetical protein [Alicyclobacillus fastidiosus]|uniref:DUF2642 domain-containing protein n=1 Tax=Alicyclobacillus fastidiosus TaxID=392011 RepID=A0ABV5AGA1_9BACL|nr:hypothetical protein [Alicyclobacillus fastidiosus]WEH08900.1 hypothetical protein PYS47_19780 [Alicyclobacillus fastidiosus]
MDLLEKRLHHRKGDKVNIFTDDGNQIIGTLDSIEDGVVKLTHATVFKNFKQRLSDVTVFVVIDKIDSFHRMHHHHKKHHHHHHHHDGDCGTDE